MQCEEGEEGAKDVDLIAARPAVRAGSQRLAMLASLARLARSHHKGWRGRRFRDGAWPDLWDHAVVFWVALGWLGLGILETGASGTRRPARHPTWATGHH